MAGWGPPADCILTEEGTSFRLWPLPCSLETPSRTASQGDPGEFRRARGEMFWGKLVASQGWPPCISLRPKDGTATFLPFFWVRGLPCAAFSLWTNRWFLWVKSSFSVPVFTLFLFYFSLSLSFFLLIHRLCSACWSLFRQNLTFKGTWWKLNRLSELVLYLFFSSHLAPLPFHSAVCVVLICVSLSLFLPWFHPFGAKRLQHSQTCAFLF